MSVSEFMWLVGNATMTVLVIAVGAFRSMAARLDRMAERLSGRVDTGDDKLAGAIDLPWLV